MYNDVRLYINGKEVEFSAPPQILYNYNVTDLQNPTIVQNSFSKTITIEGTPQNNDIFGHIWRLDRVNGEGFNPIVKAPFKLFVNGELYESGYVRLNNIKKTGNNIEYEIMLFGGLGSLFYNLSYKCDESNKKMSLADLKFTDYRVGYQTEPNLDFNITKEAVNSAWSELLSMSETTDHNTRWNIINFAVTSEGIPEDFGADKVLVNTLGLSNFASSSGDFRTIVNGNTTSGRGYTLATAPAELSMDTSFDLRSYLLRPVINVKRIINACQDPTVNGGYELRLDDHFFNYQNPYYWNAWMTLPRLRDLDLKNETNTTVTSASLSPNSDRSVFTLSYNLPLGATPDGFHFETRLIFNPTTATTSNLYTYRHLTTDVGKALFGTYVKEQTVNSCICLQAFAYGYDGSVIARSKTYACGWDEASAGEPQYKVWGLYSGGFYDLQWTKGYFRKIGNQSYHTFVDVDGNPITFAFDFNGKNFSRIEVKAEVCYTSFTLTNALRANYQYRKVAKFGSLPLYTVTEALNTTYRTTSGYDLYRMTGSYNLSLTATRIMTETVGGLFSNTLIPRDKLLATDYSPADFLLSYCKLFGLYFYKDPTEVSDEPDLYPNGVVHIVDRNTFYSDEWQNIHMMIDRGKPMTITPATAESKWYRFGLEGIESNAEKKYQSSYGVDYGQQLVNTSMNFNNETKDLYDGSVFKNGIMVLERNKYLNTYASLPAFVYDGVTYDLYKAGAEDFDTVTLNLSKKVIPSNPSNDRGLDYYDSMPKLQVYSGDGDSNDGSNVLLFFNGFRTMVSMDGTALPYMLTDDLPEMVTLNDGEPCWLLNWLSTDVAGRTVGIMKSSLPYFTRDLSTNRQIINSWNFGHPQELYVPDTYTTDGDSIYDKCWKAYINDLYDDDTRKLSCYVRLIGKPNPNMLRKWYWFDNAVWRINSIKDWNISSFDPTLVEFIKVQDVNAYALEQIRDLGTFSIILNQSTIGSAGGNVTGRVIQQDQSGRWSFSDVIPMASEDGTTTYLDSQGRITPLTGTGLSTVFTFTVPQNTTGYRRTFTLSVEDGNDVWHRVTLVQEPSAVQVLSFTVDTGSVGQDGGTVTLPFVANNIDVSTLTASTNASWATAVIQNSNVVVTVNSYPGTGSRTVGVYLTNGSITDTAMITQTSSTIAVNPSELNFDFYNTTSTTKTLSITASDNWTATIVDEA